MDKKSVSNWDAAEATGNVRPDPLGDLVVGVIALVCGAAAVVAMFSPLLWVVGGVALLVCVLALMKIQRGGPAARGRMPALCGLALSLIYVTAAPAYYLLRQLHVEQQSAVVGTEWLNFLLARPPQPTSAFESMYEVKFRYPFQPQLIDLYKADSTRAGQYQGFLNTELIKALQLLPSSPPPQSRYYLTEKVESGSDKTADGKPLPPSDLITDVFAVTYTEVSPAERAGLKPGDMLVEINGKPVFNVGQLHTLLNNGEEAGTFEVLGGELICLHPSLLDNIVIEEKSAIDVVFVRQGKRQTVQVETGLHDNGIRPAGETTHDSSWISELGLTAETLTPQSAVRLGLSKREQGVEITRLDPRQKKSFFVRLILSRRDDPINVKGFWQVLRYEPVVGMVR